MSHRAIIAALDAERADLVSGIQAAFREMDRLVGQAFAAHAAGNLPEARILINEALDLEHDTTGDTKALGDLFEEWGGDSERDRRQSPGFTVDGECLRCGAMHAPGKCP